MIDDINFTRSAGDMDVRMRVLQTFRLERAANGTIRVIDEQKEQGGHPWAVGFGFATSAEAIAAYEVADFHRIRMG
ncbi:hypothetical protein AA12717_0927 [Gluconacetobacter sacchari DSM 12717]|uniref:Uncharacterized protein n=2 Tax=Gluconacetobacter sacchari TaxID=92759 RepID=A0A7W4NST9_9PROT|nr:hypothetical protein [Gluconacetobacter sacchari]MBB2161565.1 hypothetical protein [Gluconacetobacter sacchari]GBQ21567.1 hypothetical protein AA12717_0927 [Gluconacetobacter sacchari DSM 12717]